MNVTALWKIRRVVSYKWTDFSEMLTVTSPGEYYYTPRRLIGHRIPEGPHLCTRCVKVN
jgi:hypothetical protein